MHKLRIGWLALLAAGMLAYWIWQGQAHSYPAAPAGQFACLSYTPRSDSSRGAAADIHAQIERDLQQLSKRTGCVRTYSVMNGLDYVPLVARKLQMRVLLGIWIGSNSQANEMEIAHAIDTANANQDVITAVIVGNEVLLRREQTADALYQMLVRVRTATKLPVTYADVWDFWLKNPRLAEVSDFVTIHILPYWDDQPIGIDHAMQQVQKLYQQLQQKFPGKPIYIGETGWPSAGRQRESATPSLLNQARFTREFIVFASQHHIPYNFIEAYDQPWKKQLEGTVGGYWGLYDAQGREKFPLVGAVIADPQWWRGPLCGVIFALLLWLLTRLNTFAALPRWEALLTGFSLGAVLVMQWDYAWRSNRNWQEWCALTTWALLGHAVFVSALARQSDHLQRSAARLLFVWLFGAAYLNLGLVFEARYRDFPSMFLLLPTVLLLLKRRQASALRAEVTLLSAWLLLSSCIIAINEGISNGSALWWCGVVGLLGATQLIRRHSNIGLPTH
jgi:exo-beta-1,3-glucanase (GH17 family)